MPEVAATARALAFTLIAVPAALDELVAMDGTRTLAIKRRRRNQAILDLISSWEAADGPIDPAHLEWADRVLDRQGVPR